MRRPGGRDRARIRPRKGDARGRGISPFCQGPRTSQLLALWKPQAMAVSAQKGGGLVHSDTAGGRGVLGGGPSSAGAARGVLCPICEAKAPWAQRRQTEALGPQVPAVHPKSFHPWDRGRSQSPEVHRDRDREARRPRMRDHPRCTVDLGRETLLGAHAQTGEGPEHKPHVRDQRPKPRGRGGGGANLKGRIP